MGNYSDHALNLGLSHYAGIGMGVDSSCDSGIIETIIQNLNNLRTNLNCSELYNHTVFPASIKSENGYSKERPLKKKDKLYILNETSNHNVKKEG